MCESDLMFPEDIFEQTANMPTCYSSVSYAGKRHIPGQLLPWRAGFRF